MFEELRREYLQDRERQKEENAFFIVHGFCKSWRQDEQKESDNGLRRYSTDRRWTQYTNGEIDRETACKYAISRNNKKIEKETAAKIEHLDRVAAAEIPSYITVNVEWKKNNYWGNCPRVEVTTNTERDIFSGYASGCGYDKESAAVASAFNSSRSILKALYTLKEEALKAGKSDKSETACTGVDNRYCIGYGAGYSVIPYFEGGVGVGCFWSILKALGYETQCNYGKRETLYRLYRKEA